MPMWRAQADQPEGIERPTDELKKPMRLQWDFLAQKPRSLIFIIFLYIKYLNPIFQAKMRLWYFFREKNFFT